MGGQNYGIDPAVATQIARDIAEIRSEEHTSELQSLRHLVCRLLLEKKKKNRTRYTSETRSARYRGSSSRPRRAATHCYATTPHRKQRSNQRTRPQPQP